MTDFDVLVVRGFEAETLHVEPHQPNPPTQRRMPDLDCDCDCVGCVTARSPAEARSLAWEIFIGPCCREG